MFSRLTPRAFSAGVFATFCLFAASNAASAQSVWGEIAATSNGPYPADTATSFNNNRGGIRYSDPSNNSDVVAIWNLLAPGLPGGPIVTFGGGTLKSGSRTNLAGGFWGYQPSDRIEMNNIRSHSIGSGVAVGSPGPGDDETYIELVDMTVSPMTLLQLVIGPDMTKWDESRAGLTNDLALTRDGAWGVVNAANHIFVINLAATSTATMIQAQFDIGEYDYSVPSAPVSWINPCTPNHAVDSVAVTNDRAVVTTARYNAALGGYTTWVYIVDLSGSAPQIVLQHEIDPSHDPEHELGEGDLPHDVAITTDINGVGQTAVVTTTHMVAAYDIVNNAFLNRTVFDPSERRTYQTQVDSVEVTDRQAVVISDHYTAGIPSWHVQVFSLNLPTGLTQNADYSPQNASEEGRAHDLALDKDLNKALVRTSNHNLVVTSVNTPPPTALLIPSPNGSDAFAYEVFKSSVQQDVFSSDSVVIARPLANGAVIAATIGGRLDPNTNLYVGYVDVLDLGAATPFLVKQTRIDSASLDYNGCVPLDLGVSHDQLEVVVRSADPYPDPQPGLNGADLVRVALSAATGFVAQYGGQGYCMGHDSLAIQPSGDINTAKRMMSISQDPVASQGWVHIAR